MFPILRAFACLSERAWEFPKSLAILRAFLCRNLLKDPRAGALPCSNQTTLTDLVKVEHVKP